MMLWNSEAFKQVPRKSIWVISYGLRPFPVSTRLPADMRMSAISFFIPFQLRSSVLSMSILPMVLLSSFINQHSVANGTCIRYPVVSERLFFLRFFLSRRLICSLVLSIISNTRRFLQPSVLLVFGSVKLLTLSLLILIVPICVSLSARQKASRIGIPSCPAAIFFVNIGRSIARRNGSFLVPHYPANFHPNHTQAAFHDAVKTSGISKKVTVHSLCHYVESKIMGSNFTKY